jgi:two-component system NtrC family sensor kinase
MPLKGNMKNKISHKLIALGSITIAIVGVFSFLIIRSQQRSYLTRVEFNAHQLSEMIKNSTKFDMLYYRRDHVHNIIDTIGRQEGIEKVRIFNKEGKIIYSSDKSLIDTMVDKYAEACYACHTKDQALERLSISERTRIFKLADNQRSLGIINPIYNEPGCWQGECHAHSEDQKVLGVLDVSMSLAEGDRLTRANTLLVIFMTFLAMISISLILWFFFQRLINRPVQRLVKATNAVAAGDLTTKLEVKRQDELGHLVNSFNAMTQKLEEAQTQIYHSDKLASIGRLAAGVAHEINNPLTGVLSYSSFLLKRVDGNPEMKADLEIIVRETKRCREIVKGLLDFARPVPTRKANVSLNDVVQRALNIVDNQLQFKHITVHQDLSQSLPDVTADAGQLQQVFINLLVNAADAIEDTGGEIFITSDAAMYNGETCVQISLKDTGCGIAQENLSKIFEPFYTTKAQKGTGLGLAVVWGIIDKHGGTISVKSEEGTGSTFTIILPLSKSSLIKSKERL